MALDLAKVRERAANAACLTESGYPSAIPGRIAHIDADFTAHQVAAETKAELDPIDPTPRKSVYDMKCNAYSGITHIRKMARAEKAVVHVTRSETKGNRTEIAKLKPYQGNRDSLNNPEHLELIRDFIATGCAGFTDSLDEIQGIVWSMQEADDGMAQAHFKDPHNTVICSADKDLLMVPGYKLDIRNQSVRWDDSFGWIDLDCSKSAKKLVGVGTKFFWAQCLMGDPADNINGIPLVPSAFLENVKSKPKKCGPAMAHYLLKDAESDNECFKIVKQCYKLLHENHGYEFCDYRDSNVKLTPTQALLSEMKLLWMRRSPDENDVLDWIKKMTLWSGGAS